MNARKYKTAESVTEGHPDKVCDIVSDALVDLFLSFDHGALVSIKALATRDNIYIAGEVGGYKCSEIPIEKAVRETIKEIGYIREEYGFNYETLNIVDKIDRHEINDFNKLKWDNGDLLGSRDQGIVFGYACNETSEYMPLPVVFANKLTEKLTDLRKKNILNYLGPDGKAQVTIEYNNGAPSRAASVVISALHDIDVTQKELESDLIKKLIKPTLDNLFDENTLIYINPTGRFVIGGPAIDTGLTGRKLIVDTYGDACKHGGGAFSGKDPTSSDRCGAYLARYVAKNIVAANLAKECEIEFSYVIGGFAPIHINVNTNGTGIINDEKLENLIKRHFDLTISGTITALNLRKPIYKQTSAYGHFGRIEDNFTWEKLDKIDELREAIENV